MTPPSSAGLDRDSRPSSRPGGPGSAAGPASSAKARSLERLPLGRNYCTFYLGGCCYALDAAAAGEVVRVETWIPVPLAPAPVLGLFSLRGQPVALVDLATVLGLPESVPAGVESWTALVLRPSKTLAAAVIDRMDAIVPAERAVLAPSVSSQEHPAVAGFLEMPDGRVVTALSLSTLLEKLRQLRFRNPGSKV